jgi:aromatic-L-amino-acid/L-tryptophan decarboxylase
MEDRRETLDPADWEPVRELGHRMVDEAVDHTRGVRERPVWQDMSPQVRPRFRSPAPRGGQPLEALYDDLFANLPPYPWATSIRASGCGMWARATSPVRWSLGRDRQAGVNWMKEMMGYPPEAICALASGGSMANLIGLPVGTHPDVRH